MLFQGCYLRSILQARQLVFLSNVCIWKLCWLAVALSGLMLDLDERITLVHNLALNFTRRFICHDVAWFFLFRFLKWGKMPKTDIPIWLFYLQTDSQLNAHESQNQNCKILHRILFVMAVFILQLYSHGHFKLLHPLPLCLLSFTKELEALLPLQVDQVEAVRPLGRKSEWTDGRESVWMAVADRDRQKSLWSQCFSFKINMCKVVYMSACL